MAYYRRHIDSKLLEWKESARRKPLLIRGARQVGKTAAVRELGKTFKYFVEINLEKQPDLIQLFPTNIDVKKTCEKLSGTLAVPIVPGETLLFIDENGYIYRLLILPTPNEGSSSSVNSSSEPAAITCSSG